MKSKLSCIVSCPIDTYSGYGARSRDFVRELIKAKPNWDIKVLSQRWGNTRFGYLDDHNQHDLAAKTITKLTYNPDIWFQITVPNEFMRVGKQLNVGVSAVLETDLCPASWIEGCNKMDKVIVSSKHSADVLKNSVFTKKDNNTQQVIGQVRLEKPVDILFEGVDTTKIYTVEPKNNKFDLSQIKEDFAFLFTGHWMQGKFGHDRKNVGMLVKCFLEAFKKTQGKKPALILKTQKTNASVIDKQHLLQDLNKIKESCGVVKNLPNIYVVHGEISDREINELYNHPKVKAMLSLTKGEGFGRPLLEFSLLNKPVIASGWSGQLDFLDAEFTTLLPGELENVDSSVAHNDMLMPEAKWFKPSTGHAIDAMKKMFKDYKTYKELAKRQGYKNREIFTVEKMGENLKQILSEYDNKLVEQKELELPKLDLPKLKKIEDSSENKLKLPKLNKIE